MSSNRQAERAHSIRTVGVASAAAAIAAVVTSFFWRSGTPIAAAVTPVIVALVSELLHHPTAKITDKITSEGPLLSRDRPLPRTEALPAEARLEELGRRGGEGARTSPGGPGATEPGAPNQPGAPTDPSTPTVYRSENSRRGLGRIHPRFVIVTALVAFLIAALVITVPELISGQSLGSSDNDTSFFGGKKPESDADSGKEASPDKDADKPSTDSDEEKPKDEQDEPKPKEPQDEPKPKPAPQASPQQQQTQETSTTTTPAPR